MEFPKINFLAKKRFWIVSIIVIIIIALGVGLAVYINIKNKQPMDNDVTTSAESEDTTDSWLSTTSTAYQVDFKLITRSEWGASYTERDLTLLSMPIKRIIITHTADSLDSCYSKVKFSLNSLNFYSSFPYFVQIYFCINRKNVQPV